jgi:uncharacterized protein
MPQMPHIEVQYNAFQKTTNRYFKPVNVLVEILHPAHVHFFKHAIHTWRARGDNVLVLSREKECANDLLRAEGIPFISISAIGDKKISLLSEMMIRNWRMWKACRTFKPDVLTGIMGVTIAQVGKLIGVPAVVFYDTENAKLTNRFVYPLAHSVCTPDCYQGRVNGRHITYPGYHELAYLHPDRFTPDPGVLKSNGISPQEPFFLLRLVSWQASHDLGEQGLQSDLIQSLLDRLLPHGRVLISSEKPLAEKWAPYRFSCPPQCMHHFLAFAQLIIGESATMASEAAVLGTPAFFISDTGRGYTDEEEKRYGLVFNFKRHETPRILDTLDRLLDQSDMRASFHEKRATLLKDKVDTTAWLLDYIDRVTTT